MRFRDRWALIPYLLNCINYTDGGSAGAFRRPRQFRFYSYSTNVGYRELSYVFSVFEHAVLLVGGSIIAGGYRPSIGVRPEEDSAPLLFSLL